MRTRWDDIEILRAIDALQEQRRGEPVSGSGRKVTDGIAGSRVTFADELDLARSAGLLIFDVADHAVAYRLQNTDFYLRNMRKPALTIAGRDRARGRVVQVPLPDPGEDDGRLISRLVLGQIAEVIEQQYSRVQAVVFLDRAASWVMPALSMAAIAVAVLTGYVPARLRRLRAQARGAGLGLLAWLGAQRPAFLFGNLLAANLPLMVFLLVAGLLIAITQARFAPAPVWLPAGSLLTGAGAGLVLSAAEVWLLRRGRAHGRKPPTGRLADMS